MRNALLPAKSPYLTRCFVEFSKKQLCYVHLIIGRVTSVNMARLDLGISSLSIIGETVTNAFLTFLMPTELRNKRTKVVCLE